MQTSANDTVPGVWARSWAQIERRLKPLVDLPSLTGLRFIAAFSIALGHSLPQTDVWGIDFHGITALGMPIFFTLSGFIIHYSYADQFAKRGSGAVRDFAVSRFSRIYPLYWFLLVASMLDTPMGPRLLSADGLPVLAAYVVGVTTWFPFMMDHRLLAEWYYGISWSIPTEMFFYLCYAIVLWRIVNIRRARACAVALGGFLIAAFVLMWLVFRTRDAWEPALVSMHPGLLLRTQDFGDSAYRWLLYLSPYSQIFAFIAGALTGQLYRLTSDRVTISPTVLSALGWAATLGIAIMWVAFSWLGADGQWLTAHSLRAYYVNLHLNLLFVPLCCVVIYVLAIGPSSLARLLSLPIVVLFGEVSYSMYLGHPWAQGYAARFIAHAAPRLPFIPANAWIVFTMGAIFALSVILDLLVEVPSKRAIRDAWRRRKAKAGA